LEIVRADKFGAAASLRISGFFGQPENLMKLTIYEIIEEAIAAQRFLARALLVDVKQCHETCG